MAGALVRAAGAGLLALALQTPLAVRDVDRGDFSNVDERRDVVIRTQAEWNALWRQHTPDRMQPTIDFARDMVLGVFLGTSNTAGFGVEVAEVADAAGGVRVRYRERRPPAGGIVAQIITSPFHLVALPGRNGTVRFERID